MAEVELLQVGPYMLGDLLSVSSTSTFYQGKQRKKTLLIQRLTTPLTTTEQKEAFLIRGRQLKKLKNRTLVNTLDVGFDGHFAYLVMESYSGKTLREVAVSGEQLAPDQVKRYLSPIATALHYAHMSNTFHGNLHPGVIIQVPSNELLLTSFSLTPNGADYTLDETESAIPYMAPEQLQGQVNMGSDQYALATMTYEWLCGRRPYTATERDLLLLQQQQAPITAPRNLNATISPAVEKVILQALTVDPAQRFPHVQAFADAYLSALIGFTVRSAEPLPLRVFPPASDKPAQPPWQKISHQIRRPDEKPAKSLSTSASHPDEAQSVTSQEGVQGNAIPHQALVRDVPAESPFSVIPQQRGQGDASSQALVQGLGTIQYPISPNAVAGKGDHQNFAEAEHTAGIQGATFWTAADGTAGGVRGGIAGKLRKDEEPLRQKTLDEEEEEEEWQGNELTPSQQSGYTQRVLARVTADLCQGGVLSLGLPGYEERPAQVEMARLVTQAITQRVPAIVEAATGTGKSLAYLVPAVRSGQVAIVSTANKALQEQLFYKDIPFVQKHIKSFGAALVKGMGNYVCIDRVETERTGMQFFTRNHEFQRLIHTINDPESTFNGDFETLDFSLPTDVRSRVATDSDQCAWNKCNYFSDCYVRQMREDAQLAQIIVVNHTLLLLDAAMDGFLLPERDVIILDEAHHLEEEATRSFTITINPAQIQILLAQRMLKEHSLGTLQDETMRNAMAMWMRLEQVVDVGFRGRANLDAPFEEGLRLATSLADLADSLRRQRPKEMPDKEGQLYDKLVKRTQNLAENVRVVFGVEQPDKFVYYVERVEGSSTRNPVLQSSAAPLDVTVWLKERLFSKCNVICTSATLATVGARATKSEEKGPNFAYFRQRVGLNEQEREDVLERILPLTFDYEQNALLYLPRDLPAPTFGSGSDEYMLAIAREMYKLVKISRGRAFLLFSSKRMLDRAYELMAPYLSFPLLKQGDMTRLELTRRFRQEEGAVLFGLKSFWEGVDIVGDALSLVVIDKLPFDPPDDPVHEARVAQMKARNENWFGTYVLPQAVLRLKQGLGRLLRTREDRGVMTILDTRLHTKGYGRLVLDALPPARRTTSLRDVDRFFQTDME